MWQTIVGNDKTFSSIRFRVLSCRFSVGYAEKWLAINGDMGSHSRVVGSCARKAHATLAQSA
jgi:hypothetical protein